MVHGWKNCFLIQSMHLSGRLSFHRQIMCTFHILRLIHTLQPYQFFHTRIHLKNHGNTIDISGPWSTGWGGWEGFVVCGVRYKNIWSDIFSLFKDILSRVVIIVFQKQGLPILRFFWRRRVLRKLSQMCLFGLNQDLIDYLKSSNNTPTMICDFWQDSVRKDFCKFECLWVHLKLPLLFHCRIDMPLTDHVEFTWSRRITLLFLLHLTYIRHACARVPGIWLARISARLAAPDPTQQRLCQDVEVGFGLQERRKRIWH